MQSVREIFSDSSESDELDMQDLISFICIILLYRGSIAQNVPTRSYRDIVVTEENHFRVSQHDATVPETV